MNEQDVERLAEWLGALPEARNVFDYTDEATTVLTMGVDDLAREILTSDWFAAARADGRESLAGEMRTLEMILDALDAEDDYVRSWKLARQIRNATPGLRALVAPAGHDGETG